MIIEIKGTQFINKGAELMLHAILKQLVEICPGYVLVLEANRYSPYLDRIKLGAYQKLSLKIGKWDLSGISDIFPSRLSRFLLKFGIVTETDIDVVLDASGFAYGRQWGEISTFHVCDEVVRYKRRGKKYIFLPQAFGPFEGKKISQKINRGISSASLIVARESVSFENLKSVVNKSANLCVYPDFTNLLPGIVPCDYVHKENQVLIIPNYNMLSVRNKNIDWQENYLNVMLMAMRAAKMHGLESVILNHEGVSDMEVCNTLAKKYGETIEIINEKNPITVKGIIGTSKLVVCSRFHGCVSALSQGVPCIGTSWSHKYEELFYGYECQSLLLKPNITANEMELLIPLALDRRESIKHLASIEKDKVRALWDSVAEVIKGDHNEE